MTKTWVSGRESQLLDDIIDGKKTIEGRLNKGKFADYAVGDHVLLRRDIRSASGQLIDGDLPEIEVKILALRHYASFGDMVISEGHTRVIPSATSDHEAALEYDKYYTKNDQEQFGVIAIEIAFERHL